MTLGMRNNNPGNMRPLKNDKWVGEVGENGGFVTFVDMAHGIRAWFKNTRTQFTKHKCDTVRKFINKYAPPNENDTTAYINNVSRALGVIPDTVLTFDKPTCIKLFHAVMKQENGKDAELITDADIEKGWGLTGF